MTDQNKVPEKPNPLPEKTVKELDGRGGLNPTRYEDWEIKGKCVDF